MVDTPGWSSWRSTPDTVSKELQRGLALCHPGPHAILLVLPTNASSFGQGEWRAMEACLRSLQIPIWQRAMVLFTHGDKIGDSSCTCLIYSIVQKVKAAQKNWFEANDLSSKYLFAPKVRRVTANLRIYYRTT